MTKLTTLQVAAKLKTTDFSAFPKPGKNKGDRGQLLELALGVANSSDLTDLVDGEIKSFTQGQTIAVTQIKHCLSEIIEDKVSFKDSKVGEKLKQAIYVGFTRDNVYIGTEIVNQENSSTHYKELEEDYNLDRQAFTAVLLSQLSVIQKKAMEQSNLQTALGCINAAAKLARIYD